MEALEVLYTRRSIKNFTPQMPTPEEIDKITAAGVAAPTGMGLQSPYIIVVKNHALRDELSRMNGEVLGISSDPFYGAPVVIAVLAARERITHLYDGSLVIGNMLNAAHAIGLGASWIHRAKEVFSSERGQQLLALWGITEEVEGIGFIAVGHAASGPKPAKPRKAGYVRTITETVVQKGVVEDNGFLMDYFQFGSGTQPLVLLPGISTEPISPLAETVASQYHRFHQDYTTYLFDRKRNLGDHYTIEQMADDTAAAMRQLGIRNACVLGVSQGGMIAQILAAKHPDLVSKLALCCTTSCWADVTENTLSRWVEIAQTGDVEALNRAFYANLYSDAFQQQYAAAIEAAVKVGTPEGLARFIRLANACLTFDARPLLNKIQCACLAVGATLDKVIGYDATLKLSEHLHCKTITYEQYGHAAYDEAADLHDRLMAFFGC